MTINQFDLRNAPRQSPDDFAGLQAILAQLIGEPFRFARVSYGDELTLHFGDLRPARSPKLHKQPYGAFILGLRSSPWVLKAGSEPLVLIAGESLGFVSAPPAPQIPNEELRPAKGMRFNHLSTNPEVVAQLEQLNELVLEVCPNCLIGQRKEGELIYVPLERQHAGTNKNLLTIWVQKTGVRMRIMYPKQREKPEPPKMYDPGSRDEYKVRLRELYEFLLSRTSLGQILSKEELESKRFIEPESRVLAAVPFTVRPVNGFALQLRLSDGSSLLVLPTVPEPDAPEDEALPELADWELLSPWGLLKAGPGLKWSFEPTLESAPRSQK